MEGQQQVQNLKEMVAYQAGSVVSKTVLAGPKGTVTLFAFDQGEELSEHTAPFDAMVHVLDGEVEISIDGQEARVREGEMIIMPANRPHALRAVQRFKMMLIMIRS